MLSSVKSGPSGLQRVILSDRLDSDPLIARERERLLSLSILPFNFSRIGQERVSFYIIALQT
jgi:hypothetical protein